MDFRWPDEYLDYKKSVINFAKNELDPEVLDNDLNGNLSEANWKKCAEFGIQGLSVPKRYGGDLEKVDIQRAMLAMEGFGYGCKDNGLSLALNAQMWTVQTPISQFGSVEQKEDILPRLADGSKKAAHALTEDMAGSDIFAMEATAKKVDGGYILTGKKKLITLAPIADYFLVFAKTKPELGKWGVSGFVLERNTSGLEIGPVQPKMGMRTVPIGEVSMTDCYVPESNLLGSEGMGFSILNHSLEYDRCCILASQLGAMERIMEESIAFTKKRKQFGQTVGKFQSVSNRIVEMKLRLETARLLLYKVAWLKSQDKSATLETAMLKLHLGESFIQTSLDAIRNRGGEGYLTEFELERNLRDAIGGVLYAGTSDIQRNIIARMLGL